MEDVSARHDVDLVRVRKRLADDEASLAGFLGSVARSPNNLDFVYATSLDIVGCLAVTGAEAKKLESNLRLSAEAVSGLFAVAIAEKHTARVRIGQMVIDYSRGVDLGLCDAQHWITGFCLNTLLGDTEAIDLLCRVSTNLFRRSSTREPEYRYTFVNAIQSYWQRKEDVPKLLLKALAETDPRRADIVSPDWVLNIDVPLIHLLFRIVDHDKNIDEGVNEGLRLWKKYWASDPRRKQNCDGFVSIPLSAFRAIAEWNDLPTTTRSDYLIGPFVG